MKDILLRVCLHAYSREAREYRGTEMLELARDLSVERRFGLAREAAGLLAGGLRDRARVLGLDVAGAPWRAAREMLVLPVAVFLLCLLATRVGDYLVHPWAWPGWFWPGWLTVLALPASALAVAGALFGHRVLAAVGAVIVLGVLISNEAALVAGNTGLSWTGNLALEGNDGSYGNVELFALWLAPAALLVAGALAVTDRSRRKRGLRWMVGVIILAFACLSLARWIPRGVIFVYLPLAGALATVIWGVATRSLTRKTAGTLLVAACCFPLLGVYSFFVPYPGALEPYFPFVYYAAGWLVAFIIMRSLLRTSREPGALTPQPARFQMGEGVEYLEQTSRSALPPGENLGDHAPSSTRSGTGSRLRRRRLYPIRALVVVLVVAGMVLLAAWPRGDAARAIAWWVDPDTRTVTVELAQGDDWKSAVLVTYPDGHRESHLVDKLNDETSAWVGPNLPVGRYSFTVYSLSVEDREAGSISANEVVSQGAASVTDEFSIE